MSEKMVDPESITCPVCGFYCLGKGGYGCIDKPSYYIKTKGGSDGRIFRTKS